MVSDSLSHFSFEDMTDAAAKLGISSVKVNTGNWSSAPHLELNRLLRDSAAREKFLHAFRQRDLELIGLEANGNQLHPTDGERQSKVLHDTVGRRRSIARRWDRTTFGGRFRFCSG